MSTSSPICRRLCGLVPSVATFGAGIGPNPGKEFLFSPWCRNFGGGWGGGNGGGVLRGRGFLTKGGFQNWLFAHTLSAMARFTSGPLWEYSPTIPMRPRLYLAAR